MPENIANIYQTGGRIVLAEPWGPIGWLPLLNDDDVAMRRGDFDYPKYLRVMGIGG